MADPKQKSLEAPYLWRIPTLYQIPQWGQVGFWRNFVRHQSIVMLCRQHLINHLIELPQAVVTRDADEKEKYEEDCHYYNKWVLANFDDLVSLFLQDFLDLPIGGNAEVTRWPVGVKPDIRVGGETFKVTGDHPLGHPFEIIPIDGATLFPTYDKDLPIAQRIPELDKVVYFTPEQIMRIGWLPRVEMRLKGYNSAPPEQVYLAIDMINSADHYYSDLLNNIPPVGILDFGDATYGSTIQWAASTRSLFESNETFKIPIVAEHTTPVTFIPFGKDPQELLMDTAGLRYARITSSSYGLTLGNLGLEPKGETMAGSIRDDKQAQSGKSFVVEKTKGVIDSMILPPYLEWKAQVTNYEELTGKGRAQLVVTQALKATVEAGALKPSEMQAQLIRDGFITVEVETPNDEELAQQKMAKQLPFGGKPGANGNGAAKQLTDKVPAAEGGFGDVKKEKAEVESAPQDGINWEAIHRMESDGWTIEKIAKAKVEDLRQYSDSDDLSKIWIDNAVKVMGKMTVEVESEKVEAESVGGD